MRSSREKGLWTLDPTMSSERKFFGENHYSRIESDYTPECVVGYLVSVRCVVFE